ncbi:TIGR02444 family protein [Paraliomyxa miuraensis]|uniref:TIGR02444 family protein n=1 Tax=Paraliomyxa miuraensis TaxID=376150 RepID=UPI0022543281|nr:TIGR02444 family protein [Paraliomyxa miuraensis]MCX4246808.1 TIGR02444 family protein [Paraliomyxa miuraensis]
MPGSSPTASPRDALWRFAVRTYALPGVAPLCLRLQDEHGVDVDVVLGLLWLAERGVELDEASLTAMLDAAAPVHARVEQLRVLRRAVSSDREHDPRWQSTYEHLKAAELAAERVELSRIEAAVAPLVVDPAAPRAHDRAPELAGLALPRYAEHVNARESEPLLRELVVRTWPDARA